MTIKRHIAYLKYILRHKYFVFVAGRRIGGVSLWRLLIHDWSKFLPSEWVSYAYTFYNPDGTTRYIESEDFLRAWNAHQKRNKHHWQYWYLVSDNGMREPLRMPHKYAREMIADWMGAGRAIHGHWDITEWYSKNFYSQELHPATRSLVESILKC